MCFTLMIAERKVTSIPVTIKPFTTFSIFYSVPFRASTISIFLFFRAAIHHRHTLDVIEQTGYKVLGTHNEPYERKEVSLFRK